MGDSLENPDVSLDAQNAVIVDYGAFANYLRKAATILLPENNNDDNYPPAVSVSSESILLISYSVTHENVNESSPDHKENNANLPYSPHRLWIAFSSLLIAYEIFSLRRHCVML